MAQNPTAQTVLAIAAGAIPGAAGRFYVTEAARAILGQSPWGTIAVNVLGSFILGWVITANQERFQLWSPAVRLAIATGFCGAFTTFSTYGLETVQLLDQGGIVLAIAYCAGSAIAGLAAVWLGAGVARRGIGLDRDR